MISLILNDLRGGGAERVSIDLARALAYFGHKIEFVLMCATGDFLPEAEKEFSVVDLAAERMRSALPPIVRYLRVRQPDAVLAIMWPLTVITPLAATLAGYHGPVVVSEHGILSSQYDAWGSAHRIVLRFSTSIAYRLATASVGVSRGVAADMARLACLDRLAVAVIHNPVRFLPRPKPSVREAAEATWNTTGPRILTVGAMKPVKNHALLLRAFAKLQKADARLMLVGQGQTEAALRTVVKELGIVDRVLFAGFQADPAPFYASADLFVLSSDHEGFGNVIVEAMSFGLPIVSTDCPSGPAEILEHGRWGWLVPVGDAAALAHAMDEALSVRVDHEALKRRSLDFAPEIAARKYLDLLGLP